MQNKSILWIDDHISNLQAYVEALKVHGFDVVTSSDVKEAVERCSRQKFDVILCDIWMSPVDGVEVLRRIRPLQRDASCAVLSSYLYLQKFRDELKVLDFPVQLLDKDMPHVEAPDFGERFINPIKKLASDGVTHTIADQDAAVREAASEHDPYSIELTDFLQRTIVEKDVLVRRAEELAKKSLRRAFDEGHVWVLMCGDKDIVRRGAKPGEEIPGEEEILEYARTQRRAPFQFFKQINVESHSWSDCPDDNTLDYPTVSLELAPGHLEAVHFDTGAPISFFSYEELIHLGILSPTQLGFATASRGEHRYWCISIRLENVLIRCQTGGQTRQVTIRGQAVREWTTGPYRRLCLDVCQYKKVGMLNQLCRGRIGLVGRNLITENGLVLVLDGIQKKTSIQ